MRHDKEKQKEAPEARTRQEIRKLYILGQETIQYTEVRILLGKETTYITTGNHIY
jgi:hypothetical protein